MGQQIQNHTSKVATPNQKSILRKSNPKPEHVHFVENDYPPGNSSTEASTQAMAHECLSDGGMDPFDINNVMPAFKTKA